MNLDLDNEARVQRALRRAAKIRAGKRPAARPKPHGKGRLPWIKYAPKGADPWAGRPVRRG